MSPEVQKQGYQWLHKKEPHCTGSRWTSDLPLSMPVTYHSHHQTARFLSSKNYYWSQSKGGVFTCVCQSFCPWGVCIPARIWEGGCGQRGVWAGSVDRGCVDRGCWQGYMDGGCALPPEMATAAVGTHPTGMHTCFKKSRPSRQGYHMDLKIDIPVQVS